MLALMFWSFSVSLHSIFIKCNATSGGSTQTNFGRTPPLSAQFSSCSFLEILTENRLAPLSREILDPLRSTVLPSIHTHANNLNHQKYDSVETQNTFTHNKITFVEFVRNQQ